MSTFRFTFHDMKITRVRPAMDEPENQQEREQEGLEGEIPPPLQWATSGCRASSKTLSSRA